MTTKPATHSHFDEQLLSNLAINADCKENEVRGWLRGEPVLCGVARRLRVAARQLNASVPAVLMSGPIVTTNGITTTGIAALREVYQ